MTAESTMRTIGKVKPIYIVGYAISALCFVAGGILLIPTFFSEQGRAEWIQVLIQEVPIWRALLFSSLSFFVGIYVGTHSKSFGR